MCRGPWRLSRCETCHDLFLTLYCDLQKARSKSTAISMIVDPQCSPTTRSFLRRCTCLSVRNIFWCQQNPSFFKARQDSCSPLHHYPIRLSINQTHSALSLSLINRDIQTSGLGQQENIWFLSSCLGSKDLTRLACSMPAYASIVRVPFVVSTHHLQFSAAAFSCLRISSLRSTWS